MKMTHAVTELLSTPLSPSWTIEGLAESLLDLFSHYETEISFDAQSLTDRQSQRVIRPLLAHLAVRSATEANTTPNLYEGTLTFQRTTNEGIFWITGEFENKQGSACFTLRRSNTAPIEIDSGKTPAIV